MHVTRVCLAGDLDCGVGEVDVFALGVVEVGLEEGGGEESSSY